MATTTNFGWTTPDDTDLVKDGAAAIRTLGSNIDTSLVDLNGGTTGQYLQKNSGTDLDYVWADVAAAPSSANSTVATQETTTSGSYAALTTAQAVTLTTGTKVLVMLTAECSANNGGYQFMSFAVSGATTISASDTYCLKTAISSSVSDDQHRLSSVNYLTVTAGSNTFTAQFKQSGGNAIFKNRQITVIDLGS